MTFTHRIKQEIITNKMSHNQARELIFGICYSIGYLKNSVYTLKIKNTIISNLIDDILKVIDVDSTHNPKKNDWITFNENQIKKLRIPSKYISQFAAGLFIGGGSISDSSSSSYHLEIRINNFERVKEIADFFKKHKFYFNIIKRDTHNIIYIKKSDQISDFLRAIGSYGGVMEFEEFRINRDFKNNINRISNLEVHNQYKIAKSSIKQIDVFKKIKKRNIYESLPINYKRLMNLRIENKFVSLSELADLYNLKYRKKINKSQLNNWIKKIKKI